MCWLTESVVKGLYLIPLPVVTHTRHVLDYLNAVSLLARVQCSGSFSVRACTSQQKVSK